MEIDHAIHAVAGRFPFAGYLDGIDDSCRDIASTVVRYLQPGSRILDFGSGPCDKSAVLTELGFQCSACDDLSDHWHLLDGNREKILDFIRSSGIDFRLLSHESMNFEPQSFEMVMAHAVLDHLHDSPRELMNRLLEFLKPNGLLFVTLPNAANIRKRIALLLGKTNLPAFSTYYWYPGRWRGHVREYVAGDLRLLTEYLGIEIVELRGCHHLLRRVPASMRPVYQVATAMFPGWRDSWSLIARKPSGWKAQHEIPADRLAAILQPVVTAYRYAAPEQCT
jgi:SAM-dependent methyltransferase